MLSKTVTRTYKSNDRDHVGLAAGTAAAEEHLPRYFAKSGYAGEDPKTTKKQGSGKGNWGKEGVSELEDYAFNQTKPRRRTNSSTAAAGHSMLKTKFEAIDPEVIEYEEDVHGPGSVSEPGFAEGGDDSAGAVAGAEDGGHDLEKMSTGSSAGTMGSVDEEENGVVGVEKK